MSNRNLKVGTAADSSTPDEVTKSSQTIAKPLVGSSTFLKAKRFRAWDERNKVMHDDFQFIKTGDDGNDWILFVSDKQPISSEWQTNPYFSQQLKIMEYVGINDVNAEPLCEGDIIEFAGLGVIMYDEDRFFVHYGTIHSRVSKHMKKVGNIYENPELLG